MSVLESGRSPVADAPAARLIAIDVRTNARATLARGGGLRRAELGHGTPCHRRAVGGGGRSLVYSPGGRKSRIKGRDCRSTSKTGYALALLPSGVLPAIDAVIARGFADPDRIAIAGQSDGGFATLGLITQTGRFRSAIASGSFCDLASLYGTFHGQYRHGDAGPPQKGQVFRMLQMEKGSFGLGGPPWTDPDRYRAGSAIFGADQVETPLMLVHGDLDFIPIQQAEEFFTALYRQDKRARLVRYQGEWHTIAARANVLDLWKRIADWLAETMAPRNEPH